jgi:hypothetical protein
VRPPKLCPLLGCASSGHAASTGSASPIMPSGLPLTRDGPETLPGPDEAARAPDMGTLGVRDWIWSCSDDESARFTRETFGGPAVVGLIGDVASAAVGSAPRLLLNDTPPRLRSDTPPAPFDGVCRGPGEVVPQIGHKVPTAGASPPQPWQGVMLSPRGLLLHRGNLSSQLAEGQESPDNDLPHAAIVSECSAQLVPLRTDVMDPSITMCGYSRGRRYSLFDTLSLASHQCVECHTSDDHSRSELGPSAGAAETEPGSFRAAARFLRIAR